MGDRTCSEPIKLVLADDHDQVRRLLRFLFEDDPRFCVVAEAADGHEAIAVAPLADTLVLDIAMPDIDGITALDALKAISQTTAVIVYTAYDQPAFRAAALGCGAAAFVSKATGFDALAEAIAAAAPNPRLPPYDRSRGTGGRGRAHTCRGDHR
jgi:DNA-binding NarL/FixJ family response regulator